MSTLDRTPSAGTVYVVESDKGSRERLGKSIRNAGWTARLFTSADEFLAAVDDSHPACVVLDPTLRVASGAGIVSELAALSLDLPMLVLVADGPGALMGGKLPESAFDFIDREEDGTLLVRRIGKALAVHEKRRAIDSARKRFASLTPRELEVCRMITEGKLSKIIAQELSISVRTVHHHRQHIMGKTAATSAAELAVLFSLSREDAD